ncbi:uncharacterized protein YqgQ [Sinobaca qinghaiensis]|uniref:Uncharacterized protein YqgQ n=1 Tax=Sinobaca qinghaiensis TaxID=342944 RepID=A0A419V3E3_9BACL|nr:YqgQ family protein [Sinobaca qinghaiensis]RKD72994.1 uncharacterized protein YqgQ [Sinobaca qinghaiensis]
MFNENMKTIADVRKWLVHRGTVIYTRDRMIDLEMMDQEFTEFYQQGMIDKLLYLQAKRIISGEKQIEQQKRGTKG